MSNRRTLMAAAAIVLAAVAGIGVYLYASNADKRAQDNAHFVDAFVATSDIAKGTTGQEALQAGLIAREKVARGSLPPSIVTNANDLIGKVAAGRIDTKQFITSQTFVSAAEGVGGPFAQAIAREDLVAVTINVDAERGVANQIAPGDHVNIATTTKDDNGVATTTWFLEDVKVLAVGAVTVSQPVASADGTATQPVVQSGLLTFEVTAEEALQVIDANSGQSNMYLVLLPPKLGSSSGGTATPASGSR